MTFRRKIDDECEASQSNKVMPSVEEDAGDVTAETTGTRRESEDSR